MNKIEKYAFHLSDIPPKWEIELEQSFVEHLDRVNRPWRYNGAPRPHKATFCRAGTKRKKYIKNYEQYSLENGLFERLWSQRRYRDSHFPKGDPRRNVDTGNWIYKYQIQVIKKLEYTDAELEKHIIGLRLGASSQTPRRYLHFKHLPIHPNKCWAWLLGIYFSSGAVYLRERYYSNLSNGIYFRIRAHNPVIPLISEKVQKVGSSLLVHNQKDEPLIKRTGLGTTRRPYISLPYPIFLVLEKMGLKYYNPTGTGARGNKPVIPSWIKQSSEHMQSFIEGFLNGGRGRSFLYHTPVTRYVTRIKPKLMIALSMVGKPENHVKKFLEDINSWFISKGYTGWLRQETRYLNSDPDYVAYDLYFHRTITPEFFLNNFDVRRPAMRARLFIMLQAKKDKLLNQILCVLETPDNVILGMILEQPLTKEQIIHSLQIRPEGATESLNALEKVGLIREKNSKYIYEPSQEFRANLYKQIKSKITSLDREVKKYYQYYRNLEHELLYICSTCKETTTSKRCEKGHFTAPLERKHVLMPIVKAQNSKKRYSKELKNIIKEV